MKIAIVSKDDEACERCEKEAAKYGLKYDEKNPEVVLTYGGDGTLLHAERQYPGIPKLPLRKSATCQKCHDHEIEHAIDLLSQGKYGEEEMLKLEATVKGETLIGLNDIIIRNKNLEHAIRFDLIVDDKTLFEHLIGDGLVAATPFGSTAYYSSITKEPFGHGIGLALNNVMKEIEPMLLDETCKIKIKIVRGPAEIAADNMRSKILLEEGDEIAIKAAEEKAVLIRLK